jgi:hypothetical protein
MSEQVEYLDTDKKKIAEEYILSESKKMEEEKRKRNTAIVNDIFDKDLKSLLINNWENPNILPLLLQIKNVQYLEEQHKKESGK